MKTNTTASTPRTLSEALDQGYRMADTTYQRGYISRKVNMYAQPVKVAGGSRRGQLYIDAPLLDLHAIQLPHLPRAVSARRTTAETPSGRPPGLASRR